MTTLHKKNTKDRLHRPLVACRFHAWSVTYILYTIYLYYGRPCEFVADRCINIRSISIVGCSGERPIGGVLARQYYHIYSSEFTG